MIRVLALVALMAVPAWAGTEYDVSCSDAKCGFVTSIGIGGGKKFDQASGYCKKCDKAVSVTWKRDREPMPSQLRFWDPLAGQLRAIFDCPKCKTPFVMIDQIEDLKHCPKCGKPTLTAKRTRLYD